MRKLPYDLSYISFITTVTKNRRPLFLNPKLAERLGTMIQMACRSKGFVTLAYTILPEHLHLLVCSTALIERASEKTRSTEVEGGFSKPPEFTVGNLMQSIKGTFSRTLGPGPSWQPGYFNWYVTDPRDLLRITNYVMNNYRKTNLPDYFGREPYVWIDEKQIPELLS